MEDNSKLIEDQKQDIIFRIIRARDKANLSARALSQKIGLNDGYINRLESKKDFLPSLDVLLKIINVCGQTPEEFFYDSFDTYNEDIKILNLLKNTSKENKIAIITLLQFLSNGIKAIPNIWKIVPIIITLINTLSYISEENIIRW